MYVISTIILSLVASSIHLSTKVIFLFSVLLLNTNSSLLVEFSARVIHLLGGLAKGLAIEASSPPFHIFLHIVLCRAPNVSL